MTAPEMVFAVMELWLVTLTDEEMSPVTVNSLCEVTVPVTTPPSTERLDESATENFSTAEED